MSINDKIEKLDDLYREIGELEDLNDLSPTLYREIDSKQAEYDSLREEVKNEIQQQERISDGRKRHNL